MKHQFEIEDDEIIEYRKHNYWRGFTAAVLCVAPFIIFMMYVISRLSDLCNK